MGADVSLSLRPPESSSIGDNIRRRMEGRVERLEDALSLLDAVARAVARGAHEDDDVRTVREAITQLPRLDENAEKLATAPETEALVRRYTQLKGELERTVGGPSLREGLTQLLHRRARVVQPPKEDDTVLLDAPTMPSWLRGTASVMVALVFVVLTQQPLFFGLVPALWVALNVVFPRDRWFAIQPHRLFASGRINAPLREVNWSEPVRIERSGASFRVRSPSTDIAASQANERLFASWLALLTGPWLNALSPVKQNVVKLAGADDASGEGGVIFVTRDGVLFIPLVARPLVARALVNETLPTEPPWEKLVEALQHARNWNEMGPHLATKCDGAWLPRGTFTIEETGPLTLRLNRNEETTGARGRWSLIQLTLRSRTRDAALELLQAT